ncbi:MAG: 50S ribosomal protein L11 methyltransferase, partial [Prevotella histicola]|nr:50S ribosomal protein L11 methyltransferase [Prevotella histicola]
MKYIQVKFTVAPDTQDVRDILVALAGCNGFESFTEEDNELIGYCQESVFNLHSLKKIIDDFPIPNIQITFSINKIEDKNWNEEWEKNGFNPIVIDNRCAVICKNTMEKQSVQTLIAKIPMKIIIDAQQSFGTGTHETTQMIVSLLLNQDMQGKRVLDCGCGTGILGIVAAKCGAQDIVCYDIDDWSVRNTKHNA